MLSSSWSILALGARHDRPAKYRRPRTPKLSAVYSDSLDARSASVSDHSLIIKEDADLCHQPCSTLTVVDAHGTPSRGPARDAGITHRRQGTADDSLGGADKAMHARDLESLADFQTDDTNGYRQQTNTDAL